MKTTITCEDCGGLGSREHYEEDLGRYIDDGECPSCNGTGITVCDVCKGDGYTEAVTETVCPQCEGRCCASVK